VVLVVIAVTLLLGGLIRVVADKALFARFGIGGLYMSEAYALYIYRVLGAFVALTGLLVLTVSRRPERFGAVLAGLAAGFLFTGIVMLVYGWRLGVPGRYYLPDPLYCFAVAVLMLWARERSSQSE
jgi:hypothetical protein